MIRSIRLALQASIVLWLGLGVSLAQVPTGLPDFGTYDADGIVTINLAYLNPHVDLPLRSSSARNLSTELSLTLDNSLQMTGTSPDIIYGAGTWTVGSNIITKLDVRKTGNKCGQQEDATYTISGVWDGENTYHSLGFLPITISQNGCPYDPSGSGTSKDGWRVNASVSSTGQLTYSIVELDGNSHTSSTNIQDPNGNQAQFNGVSYVDASGNTVLTQSGQVPTVTYSYNGPIGSNGQPTPEQYTATYTALTVATNFGCPGEVLYSSSENLLTRLARPDGTFYAFSYEPTVGVGGAVTGRLASITLPTGGTITYTYTGGTNGVNCVDGSNAGIMKTTPDGTWNYTHSTSNGYGTTTVVAPSNDYAVYNFAGQYEVQRQIYNNGGTLLGKTITCYNGNFTNCASVNLISTISQKDEYSYPGSSSSPSLVETKYEPGIFSSRLVTQVTRYDFGATLPPGSNFISQTTTNYGSWNGSSCAATGRATAVCNSVTVDSNGVTKEARYNGYDAYANLLTEQDLVSGSTYLTKQFTYYPTGLVNVATDVNGAQTTTTYGDCNNSFPTLVNEPLNLTKSMIWDCNGEVPTSSTDEDSQITQYGYVSQAGVADPFWRVRSTTDPLNNVTWNNYSGSSLPATQESVLLFNGNASTVDNLTTLDGLGVRLFRKKGKLRVLPISTRPPRLTTPMAELRQSPCRVRRPPRNPVRREHPPLKPPTMG